MDDHHFNDIAKMEKKEQKEQKNKTLLWVLTNVLLFSLK
jgi:predicted nucleic acid-binding Zn ribbon protein